MKIEIGSKWSYKGKDYVVVAAPDTVRSKDADSGNWHPAVTYREAGDEPKTSFLFVRQEKDFFSKFESVEQGYEAKGVFRNEGSS